MNRYVEVVFLGAIGGYVMAKGVSLDIGTMQLSGVLLAIISLSKIFAKE